MLCSCHVERAGLGCAFNTVSCQGHLGVSRRPFPASVHHAQPWSARAKVASGPCSATAVGKSWQKGQVPFQGGGRAGGGLAPLDTLRLASAQNPWVTHAVCCWACHILCLAKVCQEEVGAGQRSSQILWQARSAGWVGGSRAGQPLPKAPKGLIGQAFPRGFPLAMPPRPLRGSRRCLGALFSLPGQDQSPSPGTSVDGLSVLTGLIKLAFFSPSVYS